MSEEAEVRVSEEWVRDIRERWESPAIKALCDSWLAQGRLIEAARQKLGRFPEMTDDEAWAAAGDIAAMLFMEQGVAAGRDL